MSVDVAPQAREVVEHQPGRGIRGVPGLKPSDELVSVPAAGPGRLSHLLLGQSGPGAYLPENREQPGQRGGPGFTAIGHAVSLLKSRPACKLVSCIST